MMTRWPLVTAIVAAGLLLGAVPRFQAGPNPLVAEVVRTGWLALPEVRFAGDAAEATPASMAALDRVRAMLAEHTEWTFEVQVHSHDAATPEADQALSDARAEWLVGWLRDRGIGRERLVPRGYGRARPPGSGEAARSRVELRKLNEE
jgi:OmpA-OmpF porin, OOP family